MKISDEMLMAYADGELDLVARAEIEATMARDPDIARAVERHRAAAAKIRAAYDGVLEEPVPDRLAALLAGHGTERVISLAARRGSAQLAVGRWRLPAWAAMAASLVVGLLAGVLVSREHTAPYRGVDGALVARGKLNAALDSQLASATAYDTGVRIGVSFRNRDGDYCRTFHIQGDAALAGLACRSGRAWQLQILAAAPSREGELRPATAMPIAVLQAVDAAIEGEPLDAAAEAAARDGDWRKPRNVAE